MATILEQMLKGKNSDANIVSQQNILDSTLNHVKEEKAKVMEEVETEVIKTTLDERRICETIVSYIANTFKNEISENGFTTTLKAKIEAEVTNEAQKYNLTFKQQQIVIKTVLANIIGLGVIEPYMQDEEVTEIWVQRYDNICIERKGVREKVSAVFSDEEALQNAIQRLVAPIGRTINLSKPICDGRLPDGSRFCATLPPASIDGATLTIRKFSNKALTGEDYVRLGSMNEMMLEFLQACVKAKCNIFISGGTNSGKTTLLNMLARSIPRNEMLITIEDSCELKINSPNVRRLEAQDGNKKNAAVTIQSLVKTSLRMSPNRIIVGEVRDGSIIDVISAMSTGHEGSMSTAHANSPRNLLDTRIPIFYKMSGTDFSSEVIAMQVAEAIELIVQTDFIKGKRKVTKIAAVTRANGVKVDVEDIFKWDNAKKCFVSTSFVPKRILEKMRKEEVQLDKDKFALWEV